MAQQAALGANGGFRSRLAALSWGHLLNDGSTNYLPGILPAVLATLGQPVEMAGVIITALTIGQVLQPITGRIADRMGGRSLIIVGLTMTSIGGGLIGLVHTTWVLIVLVVLIGVGNALFHPQALAGVRSVMEGRHGLATSVFMVGGEIGRGLWPTVASLIVTGFGLAGLWVIAIPGLITAPFLLRSAPALKPARSHGPAIRPSEHARPLALLIGFQSIRTLSIYSFATFIPIVWDQRGASLVTGASIISTMFLVGVIGNLVGGQLTDRVGLRPLLVISAAASAVLIVPTAYLTGPLEWVAAAVLGIAFFLTSSTTVVIGQNIFPENRSMGSGIALGFSNGVGAVAVFVVGLFIGTSVVGVFWVLGALSLASIVLVPMFDRSLVR